MFFDDELDEYALAGQAQREARTAWVAARKQTIEHDFERERAVLAELEQLRKKAVRCCRRAGVDVSRNAFRGRTKNQLRMLIREACATVESKSGSSL